MIYRLIVIALLASVSFSANAEVLLLNCGEMLGYMEINLGENYIKGNGRKAHKITKINEYFIKAEFEGLSFAGSYTLNRRTLEMRVIAPDVNDIHQCKIASEKKI